MSNSLTSQNITGAINQCIDQKLNNARFCTYATIIAVNTDTFTITAQPLVAEAINGKNNKKTYKQLPPIQNVPYYLGRTPIVGEDCILIHLDRGIKGRINAKKIAKSLVAAGGLLTGGIMGALSATVASNILDGVANTIVKHRGNVHTLSNCVAICGFVNPNKALTEDYKEQLEQARVRAFEENFPVGSVHIVTNSPEIDADGKTTPGKYFRRDYWEQVGNTGDFVRIGDGNYEHTHEASTTATIYTGGPGAVAVYNHTMPGIGIYMWKRVQPVTTQ